MAEEFDDANDIIITDEVIAIVARDSALELPSVAAMSTGIAGELLEIIGKNTPTQGVKVVLNDSKVTIDLYVILRYGGKISEIAWDIQEKVKKNVENMTGAEVEAVNIHVQGIDFTEEGEGSTT